MPKLNRTAKVNRILIGPAVAALALSLGTGCDSTSAADGFRGESVSFTDCASKCSGVLAGAEYRILLPEKWNGTLLIYSHGYRSAFPTPPDNEPVETAAEPAPGYLQGRPEVADELLARGFALAGSGFASNGWAVADGVSAAKDLYQHFSKLVAKPQRVYLWGDSMGGLITTLLAEDGPDWVSGAAAMCAPMAGLVMNMDLGADLSATYATLLDPDFPLVYTSEEAANAAFQRAATRIQDAAKGGGRDAAAVLAMAAVVDAHPKTANFDARDAASRVAGAAEASLIAMAFSTGARYEAEQRYGGAIASNVGTDYAARLSQLDRAWIDKVGGPGTAVQFVSDLQRAPVISADPAAVKRAMKPVPDGDVEVPTISVHTVADPLVIVQNQSVLADYATAAGASGNLLQLFSAPPRRFAQDGPAPYGAGHCNFTKQTRVGVIDLLDDWVAAGQRPDAEQIRESVAESGIDLQYQPPPWPVRPVTQ